MTYRDGGPHWTTMTDKTHLKVEQTAYKACKSLNRTGQNKNSQKIERIDVFDYPTRVRIDTDKTVTADKRKREI